MEKILEQLASCVERGKADLNSPHPPDMKGEIGAVELTQKAIESGIAVRDILSRGLIAGMHRIGEKFSQGKAFVPELLIAAKAMNAAMVQLKPFFDSGEAEHRGTIVIGTVSGDLHDIGKKLVGMVLEGNGWNVIDLGVNVSTDRFIHALEAHPDCKVGLSSLLTTTLVNMEKTVREIKAKSPKTQVFVGGAPVNEAFGEKIGADAYFPDPHRMVTYLEQQSNR